MTDKQHHLFGGSTAKYWTNCYGWASKAKDLPYEKPGKKAERGTALHKGVFEMYTQNEINKLLKGEAVPLDYDSIPSWPKEGPVLAEEFWNLFFTEILEGFITGKQVYIEKKVMFDAALDAGGTADIICLGYNDKGKLCCDLGDGKFGDTVVHPDEEQFLFYLVCINIAARQKGKVIDVFRSFVYQPSVFPNELRRHTFTRSEVEKAERRYLKAIAEAKKETPKFKAGEHCEWCKLRGGCTAYAKERENEMELMVLRNTDINTVNFKQVETLPDDVLAKIHLHKAKLIDYLGAVDKEIFYRFMNKQPVAGLKIIASNGRSSFKDEQQTAEVMKAHGVEPYKPAPLLGIGDMTGALMAAKGIKKAEAKAIIDSLTHKPEGKPKITTADDPRPDYVFADSASLLDGLDDDSEF